MGSEGSTRAEQDLGKPSVDPRGSDSFKAYRLGRGRVSYTKLCKCWCKCMCRCRCRCCLLRGNVEDLTVDQALDSIP